MKDRKHIILHTWKGVEPEDDTDVELIPPMTFMRATRESPVELALIMMEGIN